MSAAKEAAPRSADEDIVDDVPHPTLQYSLADVDRAGHALISAAPSPAEREEAYAIVGNWRACHRHPLNTFQWSLRKTAPKFDSNAIVAQRLKRLPAIIHKLDRLHHLSLSALQDIGGCRAVFQSTKEVRLVHQEYLGSTIRHRIITTNDYIKAPKRTGYRSLHLVFEYRSDKAPIHNGRKIEMQLRTRLQHAWATAVETAGLFLGEKFKSNQGNEQWRRFFALMGSAIALREGEVTVPKTPTSAAELKKELSDLSSMLNARHRLVVFGAALDAVEPSGDGTHFLMTLDTTRNSLTVTEYAKRDLERANADYLNAEKASVDKPGIDVVLVSVDNIRLLRAAFPNYYLDTKAFVSALDLALK